MPRLGLNFVNFGNLLCFFHAKKALFCIKSMLPAHITLVIVRQSHSYQWAKALTLQCNINAFANPDTKAIDGKDSLSSIKAL